MRIVLFWISPLVLGYLLGNFILGLTVPPTDHEAKLAHEVLLYKIHESCYKECRPYRASAFTPKGECICDMDSAAYGG